MSISKSIKRGVAALARHFGYHVGVAPPVADTLEGYLPTLFERYSVDLVIDVGAHRGEFANRIRAAGYDGRIVSFEPVPKNYNIIKGEAIEDDDWWVVNLALGDESGSKHINVMKSDNLSSFYEPSESGQTRLGDHMAIERSERVDIETVDSACKSLNIETSETDVFLKVDTQGYDERVLKGAPEILGRTVLLQTELQFQRTYEDGRLALDTLDWLRDEGFEVGGIFPVNYDRSLRLASADLVAIKT